MRKFTYTLVFVLSVGGADELTAKRRLEVGERWVVDGSGVSDFAHGQHLPAAILGRVAPRKTIEQGRSSQAYAC
jgi:hypothetical protein